MKENVDISSQIDTNPAYLSYVTSLELELNEFIAVHTCKEKVASFWNKGLLKGLVVAAVVIFVILAFAISLFSGSFPKQNTLLVPGVATLLIMLFVIFCLYATFCSKRNEIRERQRYFESKIAARREEHEKKISDLRQNNSELFGQLYEDSERRFHDASTKVSGYLETLKRSTASYKADVEITLKKLTDMVEEISANSEKYRYDNFPFDLVAITQKRVLAVETISADMLQKKELLRVLLYDWSQDSSYAESNLNDLKSLNAKLRNLDDLDLSSTDLILVQEPYVKDILGLMTQLEGKLIDLQSRLGSIEVDPNFAEVLGSRWINKAEITEYLRQK